MAKEQNHIIVSYDVSDQRRLARVSKLMKDYGKRVLKSVFECNLDDEQFRKMKDRIDDAIEPMSDSVRFYFVCEKCLGNVDVSGPGEPFTKEEEVIIT
ncbi:MAG: CRISPR-associated endonuclease Cas2 [Syntrophobacteraceae bacterium]